MRKQLGLLLKIILLSTLALLTVSLPLAVLLIWPHLSGLVSLLFINLGKFARCRETG